MISDKMQKLIEASSPVRAMFEEGDRLTKLYGKDNVFDFSLGNPNLPAPDQVKEAILEIISNSNNPMLHGYNTSSAGLIDIRNDIGDSLNKRFDTSFTGDNIVMAVGAAGGLNVVLKTLLNPGEEVIVFAPFFGEYRHYVSNYQGELVIISPDTTSFLPRLHELKEKITCKTKAVIINTPNNPTGVVYSKDFITSIASILSEKQEEFGTNIYLISDEPYRELVYDNVEAFFLTQFYHNTIVVYSYSKSLSLPGERIGYIVVPDQVNHSKLILSGLTVATRILGFVNAPSIMQRVIGKCLWTTTDITYYKRNRDKLEEILRPLGFEFISPKGAFYLFVKSPIDDVEFCNIAREYNILLGPGTAFGCPGYFRIAYCVSYETIINSKESFKKLANKYAMGNDDDKEV